MSKRWGSGSIITRKGKTGTTYAIKYRDPEGHQGWEGGFETRGAARERLTAVMREMDAGTYTARKPVKFSTFADDWADARLRIRGSTESAYRSLLKAQLVPRLGNILLCDLRLEHVQKLVNRMIAAGSKPKTIHNCITLLRTMLVGRRGTSAMRLGYIGHDPTLGLELPTKESAPIVPPTQAQVWKLIDTAKEIGGQAYPATFLDAFTGLRRNELLALCFTDVDWFSKELRIERAVSKQKADDGVHKWQWVIGPPKSKKSRRRVALTDSALKFLGTLKRFAADPKGYILPGPAGSFIDPDKFDAEVFGPVADKAGMKGMRFHDLRHFFASMLIAQNESPAYVSDQLGHSSIQITFDTYGHLFPQARADASARLEAAMNAGRKKACGSKLVASRGEGAESQETPEVAN